MNEVPHVTPRVLHELTIAFGRCTQCGTPVSTAPGAAVHLCMIVPDRTAPAFRIVA